MLTGSGEVGRETVIGIENLVLSPLLTPILELSPLLTPILELSPLLTPILELSPLITPILPLLRVTLGSALGLNKFES